MNKVLIDAVVASRRLVGDFSDAELQQAEAAAKQPIHNNRRLDLREEELVTIDGADARDFDDAVGCKPADGGNILLTVAIADVAAFVSPDSLLDEAAKKRGNSVYLPDRVLPMLPPALSERTCSLQPQQERATLACQIELDAKANIRRYRFSRAVIRSARRLVYEEAAQLMTAAGNGNGDNIPGLRLLAQLAEQLRERRRQAGAMVLETPEKKCWIDEQGEIRTKRDERNCAHYAIEEAMLLANQCAADFLIRHSRRVLHRIHHKPPAENLAKLSQILAPLNIHLPQHNALRADDFTRAWESVRRRDEQLAQAMLPAVLGTMARAQYAPDEKTGHFGLACDKYLHFTSPIRRYPDLLTHRAIVSVLEKQPFTADREALTALGEHCSQTEVQADKAEWDCYQVLMCVRALPFVGGVYDGYVSGIVKFGVFVAVPDLDADGIVRFSTMPGYWRFDEKQSAAVCDSENRRFALGDAVSVRVSAVNPEKGQIDLLLLDGDD